jgi:hypothetical protein
VLDLTNRTKVTSHEATPSFTSAQNSAGARGEEGLRSWNTAGEVFTTFGAIKRPNQVGSQSI